MVVGMVVECTLRDLKNQSELPGGRQRSSRVSPGISMPTVQELEAELSREEDG
jgi:hypothetical protein